MKQGDTLNAPRAACQQRVCAQAGRLPPHGVTNYKEHGTFRPHTTSWEHRCPSASTYMHTCSRMPIGSIRRGAAALVNRMQLGTDAGSG